MKRLLLAVLLTLVAGSTLSAQTITSPNRVEFDQADYNSTYIDAAGVTQSLVTSFVIDYFAVGAPAPMQSNPVPKVAATLVSGTTYQILFSALPSYPIGVSLQAKLHAVGPGGNVVSALSVESFQRPVPVPGMPSNLHAR